MKRVGTFCPHAFPFQLYTVALRVIRVRLSWTCSRMNNVVYNWLIERLKYRRQGLVGSWEASAWIPSVRLALPGQGCVSVITTIATAVCDVNIIAIRPKL